MLKEQDIPAPSEPTSAGAGAGKRGSDDSKDLSAGGSGGPIWKRWLSVKVIVPVVVVLIIAQVTIFGLWRLRGGSGSAIDGAPGSEITLGEFHFEAAPHERSHVERARFDLHLAFLPDIDARARVKLATHQFRVEQDIEQLMRQAHGGDFDDPLLSELKRQIQEQVNETLGIRAVADVIITDLELEHSATAPGGERSPTTARQTPTATDDPLAASNRPSG